MSTPIIQVKGLSKQYHIGLREKVTRTFREAVTDAFMAPVRNLRNLRRLTRVEHDSPDIIWALHDISFDIQPGEVVGIIGKNGAGKSTLLKILSRITEPTSGEIRLHGRVASLLEVGTGFHPELTGRENIYLNGTILGMRKTEIDRKFDEIVAFSEIEKFLDTPVKRYSSGMYVRLAFAVAAHLEPEILLIDEVLAVGDAAFQKKCLGKMGDVAHQGRTVLFVSHNMPAVRELCPRAIYLTDGSIALDGVTDTIIEHYIKASLNKPPHEFIIKAAAGSGKVTPLSVVIRNGKGDKSNVVDMDEDFTIAVTYQIHEPINNYHTFINVYSTDSTLVFGAATWDTHGLNPDVVSQPGIYTCSFSLPGHLLNKGAYTININGQSPGKGFIYQEENAATFTVSEFGGTGGAKSRNRPGIIRPFITSDIVRSDRGDMDSQT